MSDAPSRPTRVLFVCDDNTSCSQMAEAYLRALGGDAFIARSAGVDARHLHPLAMRAMQEDGIEIGRQRGKSLAAVRLERFDLIITLSETAHASTPALPGTPDRRHHPVDDPAWIELEDPLEEFRRVRDELRALVERLMRG